MTPAARPSRPEPAAGGAPAPIDVHGLLTTCDFPPPGTPVALGVSGGADSTALLLLALAAGLDPVVHHVDHGLRPGSAADAAWVSELGATHGVPVVVHRVEVVPGPNLEARARDARHAVLPPGCLLAHTADDQAETVLLHLVRGSGPTGVAAMRRDGRRPLLGLRRTDTEAVCAAHRIVPLRDPMNDDDRFARVRVRGELVPLLADIGGRDPVPLLARHAELTAELADLVDGLAAEVDPTDAGALARAHPAVVAAALRRWIRAETGSAHPPDRAAIDRIREVVEGRVRATEIAGGWRVARTRRRLRLEPPAGRVGSGGVDPASVDARG